MDLKNVRRASSAGYRLPERSKNTVPTARTPPAAADRTRHAAREAAPPPASNPDTSNTVKQDQVWRERLWRERRGVLDWEKNWNFLRNYDQLGRLKSEEPLPSNIPVFSDHVPNTTNQMYGSRLSSPLTRELVRLGSYHRRKLDPEMLPL